MMEIKVKTTPCDDDCEEMEFTIDATIKISEEATIDSYIAAFVEALKMETFSDGCIHAGMHRWVTEND